jgi:hypothetical protein
MFEIRAEHNHVIVIKELNRVARHPGTVACNIQNDLIFRMKMKKTALIVDPFDPEARPVIMPDADNFRYHRSELLVLFRKIPIISIKIENPADYY